MGVRAFIKDQARGAFEAKLNDALHLNGHVVGCGNGTDALALALRALEVGPGDEVIVPDFSFISTAETVAKSGCHPCLCGHRPATFQLDPASAERAISPAPRRSWWCTCLANAPTWTPLCRGPKSMDFTSWKTTPKALVPRGAPTLSGQAGMLGTVGTTSFFPSKNLGALGDGGAVLTRDESLAARVRRLANHGAERKYHHLEVGFNSRLDGLQAALLNVKLDHWPDLMARRQAWRPFATTGSSTTRP